MFSYNIDSTFDEWAALFDIKPLYRRVRKEDPKKIIIIHQAPEGNVQKFVEANDDWMVTHRVDLSSMRGTIWTSLIKI